ncbi:MAG TPA: hypothetical protein VH120_07285 [Gemmataceae bacterium]|nr:hypothetical protein [Gemmataceae bacterium]
MILSAIHWLEAGAFLLVLAFLLGFIWRAIRFYQFPPERWRVIVIRVMLAIFGGTCFFADWGDPGPPQPLMFGIVATSLGVGYIWLFVHVVGLWGTGHRSNMS